MARHSYEIRVIGSLGPATREAFADMAVQTEPSITVLSGDLDQRGLHAVLDRVRALGLELVEIKQAPQLDLPDAGPRLRDPQLVPRAAQQSAAAAPHPPGMRRAVRSRGDPASIATVSPRRPGRREEPYGIRDF